MPSADHHREFHMSLAAYSDNYNQTQCLGGGGEGVDGIGSIYNIANEHSDQATQSMEKNKQICSKISPPTSHL